MSSINPQNIDGTYPIAGQDNDSQGFRDNFTNIINNFTFAASELTDLQNNALLKSALNGTTLNNNMNNAQLIGAQCLQFTETINPLGSVSGAFSVDWSTGHFQTVTLTGNSTLAFAATWPATGFYTRLRLQVTTAGTYTLTLPSSVSVNINNIQGISGQTIPLTAGVYLFEFSTPDNGTTVTVQDLLRNYSNEVTGNVGNFTTANISGNLYATVITTNTGSGANLVLDPDGNGVTNVIGQLVATTLTGTQTQGAQPNISNIGGAVGGATVQGNLTTTGARIMAGYQYVSPTTGFVTTINNNIERLVIDSSTNNILANGTVTLPSANVDATIVTISATYGITNLAVLPNPGSLVKPSGNITLANSSSITYFYHSSETTWYRLS